MSLMEAKGLLWAAAGPTVLRKAGDMSPRGATSSLGYYPEALAIFNFRTTSPAALTQGPDTHGPMGFGPWALRCLPPGMSGLPGPFCLQLLP